MGRNDLQKVGTTITADKVVGKYLKLKKPARQYWGYPNSNDWDLMPAGQIFGPVYSWLNKPDGVWWVLETTDKDVYYYAKHDEDAFDWDYLDSQIPDEDAGAQAGATLWLGIAGTLLCGYQAATVKNPNAAFAWKVASAGIGGYTTYSFIANRHKLDSDPSNDDDGGIFSNLLDMIFG